MTMPNRGRFLTGLALSSVCAAFASAQNVYWEVSPFFTLTQPREWKMTIRLQVDNFEDQNVVPGYYEHPAKSIDAASGTVVFPIVPATSQSQTFLDQIKAELQLNDEVVDEEPEIYVNRGEGQPLPAGTFLAELAFGEYAGVREMQLEITTMGRSWETIYNEAKAAEVDWPKELPPVLQTLFEPEMFVDRSPFGAYNLKPIKDRVNEWTQGRPKSLPPAVTAKWIAMRVAETYRPTGRGFGGPVGESSNNVPVSVFGSFSVDGPEFALINERGSKFNLPVLLVACYRAAGIPARMVIGYDYNDRTNHVATVGDHLYPWVEFALYDETEADEKKRLTWIPVDILQLQASGAWTQPFDRPIEYFGTSDDWDKIIPIAFHFTPYWVPGVSYGRYMFESDEARDYYVERWGIGRDVRVFAPALWSWNVMPAPPRWAGQWIDFIKDTPQRSALDPLPPEVRRGAAPRP